MFRPVAVAAVAEVDLLRRLHSAPITSRRIMLRARLAKPLRRPVQPLGLARIVVGRDKAARIVAVRVAGRIAVARDEGPPPKQSECLMRMPPGFSRKLKPRTRGR